MSQCCQAISEACVRACVSACEYNIHQHPTTNRATGHVSVSVVHPGVKGASPPGMLTNDDCLKPMAGPRARALGAVGVHISRLVFIVAHVNVMLLRRGRLEGQQ